MCACVRACVCVCVCVCVSVQGLAVTRPEGAFRVDVAHFALAPLESFDGKLRRGGVESAAHPHADTRRLRAQPEKMRGG